MSINETQRETIVNYYYILNVRNTKLGFPHHLFFVFTKDTLLLSCKSAILHNSLICILLKIGRHRKYLLLSVSSFLILISIINWIKTFIVKISSGSTGVWNAKWQSYFGPGIMPHSSRQSGARASLPPKWEVPGLIDTNIRYRCSGRQDKRNVPNCQRDTHKNFAEKVSSLNFITYCLKCFISLRLY